MTMIRSEFPRVWRKLKSDLKRLNRYPITFSADVPTPTSTSYMCFVLCGTTAVTEWALQLASASDNSGRSDLRVGDNYPVIVPRGLPSDSHCSWDSVSENVKGVFTEVAGQLRLQDPAGNLEILECQLIANISSITVTNWISQIQDAGLHRCLECIANVSLTAA